jgi:hypothetical protein
MVWKKEKGSKKACDADGLEVGRRHCKAKSTLIIASIRWREDAYWTSDGGTDRGCDFEKRAGWVCGLSGVRGGCKGAAGDAQQMVRG